MLKLTLDLDAKMHRDQKPLGGWRYGDYEFLTNRKAIAKLHSNFDRIKHRVHCRIIFHKLDIARKTLIRTPTEIMPDMINFTMLNNVTNDINWIPPTSWIICHRMAHAMISRADDNKQGIWQSDYQSSEGPEAILWIGISKIWNALVGNGQDVTDVASLENACRVPHHFSNMNLMVRNYQYWSPILVSEIFTMRSARDRIFANELDVFAEALAQYMVTGSFKLKRFSEEHIERLRAEIDWAPDVSTTSWGKPRLQYGYPHEQAVRESMGRMNPDLNIVNQLIDETETKVNQRMEILTKNLVGKHLVF